MDLLEGKNERKYKAQQILYITAFNNIFISVLVIWEKTYNEGVYE
jgi:hypothetical protein